MFERKTAYSDPVERLFCHPELLDTLKSDESRFAGEIVTIRELDDNALCEKEVSPDDAALIRAALFYACGGLTDAGRILNDLSGDLPSYWLGMVLRRKGEFQLARDAFRRVGELAFYATLHHRVSDLDSVFARQLLWDPYLMVGLCEQNAFGEESTTRLLIAAQQAEFGVVFDYTWRKLIAG